MILSVVEGLSDGACLLPAVGWFPIWFCIDMESPTRRGGNVRVLAL